jgi:glutathione synthase/RimK-type ligase-like ATP-grasp enzyme
MAGSHWQIVDWKKPSVELGNAEAVRIEDVPEGVIRMALRASRLIGDGLYGIDIKTFDSRNYVIEINDNPSIDSGIEDEVMKEGLYTRIMNHFMENVRRKKAG